MAKILLVDDEPAITANLGRALGRSGFDVATAASGEEALRQVARFGPDLIVLDILMPGIDGREVLRRLRQGGNHTPVIMLTQVGDAGERAETLEEGADDYMNKPFHTQELVARIRAVLRRSPLPAALVTARKLASGALLLDRVLRRVHVDEKEVSLTPKAFAVLEHLMCHPGQMISREDLLNLLWGWDFPAGVRAVDTRVYELRKALGDEWVEPRFILTVPGQGYQFIGQVEALP